MVALRLCTHIAMYVHHIRWMVTNFSTMTKDNITEGTNRRQQRACKETPHGKKQGKGYHRAWHAWAISLI